MNPMAKQIFISGLISILFILFCLQFTSYAETINSIQTCNGQKCLTNISDAEVADNGTFFLLVDSAGSPYVRRINFSSGAINGDVILPLSENNPDQNLFSSGISKNGTKAFVYRVTNPSTGSKRVIDQEKKTTLHDQTEQGTSCRCPLNTYFSGTLCIAGTLNCTDMTSDPVCSCDNLNFLNSCAAQANGVKSFTKAACGTTSNLSCSNNSQCLTGTCPSGATFNKFTCTNSMCVLTQFSTEPCSSSSSSSSSSSGSLGLSSSSSSSSSSGSLIHIVDLTNNSIKTIIPATVSSNSTSLTVNNQGINTVSFLDSEGEQLIASNNDQNAPKLHLINSQTGEITQSISIPDIANSIEFSPDLKKGIITFKDLFAQSIGIYSVSVKKLIKLDIPTNIFFKVDRFLSNVSFDLNSKKCVVSSQDGKHVLYLVDLDNDKLIVRFLSNKFEGKTLSRISPDGTIAISVGNISDGDGIIIYKVDASNLRTMRIIKTVKSLDGSNVLDVKITPDGNAVLILLLKENEKKLKVLNLRTFSELCEYTVSSSIKNSFLANDPYGQFFLVPELQGDSVNLITDINLGPVFRSIDPLKASKNGGTQFTIDGYADPKRFPGNFKVCFGSEEFCATSVMVSDDGKIITGTTPKLPSKSLTSLLLIGNKQNKDVSSQSSSGSINCRKAIYTKSRYKNSFLFE